ncbi:hypothetical protein [Streptomyces albidus (ex Kaewkla and Franco 2022)]|uniref:hypothetical protein n=1 Tax=Streptomyces albidus (ex Kaewkla and Franco 2022) TaxID=722709 RepID=UPI0015EE9E29|nr:hypothetical protein [Streptomyces albidus (ex Kaewkla and Franco 2022)]
MRKLREAVVVAAMVGSVSMLGAGMASAQELPTVNCEQDASSDSVDFTLAGTLAPVTTGAAGDADSSATQQICGIGNDDNENTAGDSAGGFGTSVLGGAPVVTP